VEDAQLVRFVCLFGERRWDFLANVSGLRGGGFIGPAVLPVHACGARLRSYSSMAIGACTMVAPICFFVSCSRRPCCVRAGLKRTGKSCRLRWVNYLHPGLRRSRITADEERLILELHAQWGSRWSRIARNFWRSEEDAHQEQRRQMNNNKTASPSSSSPNSAGVDRISAARNKRRNWRRRRRTTTAAT
jgi:hypothetical protein